MLGLRSFGHCYVGPNSEWIFLSMPNPYDAQVIPSERTTQIKLEYLAGSLTPGQSKTYGTTTELRSPLFNTHRPTLRMPPNFNSGGRVTMQVRVQDNFASPRIHCSMEIIDFARWTEN